MSAYQLIYRVQCKTFAVYRQMLGMPEGDLAVPGNHPIGLLRVLRAYRTAECLNARKAVADRMRAIRARERA